MKDDFLNDLPLFINNSEPIGVYVIDNKLISFEEICWINNSCWLAYNFLGKLVKNQLTKGAIPERIIQQHEENFDKVFVPWPCLTGLIDEMRNNRCLAAKMTIKKGIANKVVHLHDFALLQTFGTNISVNDLQSDVYLTPEEAFILFANICLTVKGHGLYRSWTQNELFDPIKVKQRIKNHYSNYLNDETNSLYGNYLVELFCVDYVEYLQKQLSLKTISPATILRLNGPRVLTSFIPDHPSVQFFIREKITELLKNPKELTLNQKISYYTLFKIAEFWESLPEISEVSNENKSLLNSIFKELVKEFQKATGPLFDRNEVYNNYLGRKSV